MAYIFEKQRVKKRDDRFLLYTKTVINIDSITMHKERRTGIHSLARQLFKHLVCGSQTIVTDNLEMRRVLCMNSSFLTLS